MLRELAESVLSLHPEGRLSSVQLLGEVRMLRMCPTCLLAAVPRKPASPPMNFAAWRDTFWIKL